MSQTDEDIEDIPTDEDEHDKSKFETETEVKSNSEDENGHLEEEEVEEDEPSVYDTNQYISGPRISKHGTLPENVLEFHFSYGYNCRKNFNIVVLDSETVIFASGNLLNFFEIETKRIWFRRSALGGGIAHIRKNPNISLSQFAVAESGRRPIIILYEWPSMNIICILKGGAQQIYSNMDYSPDGELLVSQSGEPDYLITVWNWRERKILLRNKSYVNDVYRVKFSPYIPGQITTCGVSHIKFWKMATTFTGLKLKGEIGRFGKTEYSDILGVLPMPDSKVVSGCEWGNILVWDNGLITLEIFRSMRRKCHDAPIVQITYNEGELWTVSLDGHVRIWWYEKIDHADPPDDDRVLLLDPSYDFYTPGLMLYSIEKRVPNNPEDSWYVAQDGNGGIWLIDLNTEIEPRPSRQIYKCHAGEVAAIAAYPSGPYLASLGKDGRIYLYNYLRKELIFHHAFPAKGSCLIWPGSDIIGTTDVIIAGFDDGQIRICCLLHLESETNISLTITQIIKPHSKPITKLSINLSATVLVSSSEDSTIFVFALKVDNQPYHMLVPIGFIPTPDIVTCIAWHPLNYLTVVVGCLHGQMMQVTVPCEPQSYTDISYLLKVNAQYLNFKTYKAQVRRNIQIKNIQDRKRRKVEKKRKEMEQIKKDNPGLAIDEETFLADSESEEKLEPLFIPEIPNKILWLRYTDDDTIWVSMGGYDAGYIYEYKIDQKEEEPFRYQMVHDGDDIEISSYVHDYRKEYLIFAMQDGSIRVNKVNKNDFRDLSDYWILPMHDNQHGFVPKMCFSFDGKFFFSCGFDGNIFSFKFQPKIYIYPKPSRARKREEFPDNARVVDSNNYTKLSLEETKIKTDEDRIQNSANMHKATVRNILKSLKERYSKVLVENAKLLTSQMIGKEELELNQTVTEYIDRELDDKLQLVERKLAFDLEKSKVLMDKLKKYVTDPVDKHPIVVKGINDPNIELMTVRQRVMAPLFGVMMRLVKEKLVEERTKGRQPERTPLAPKPIAQRQRKKPALEYFLLSLTPSLIEQRLGPRLNRMLEKYRRRRDKWDKRVDEWDQFMAKKPIPGKNHPDDEKLLEEAGNTIGDYKLKENDDYKPPACLRETTVKKYKQLLDCRLKQYRLRHRFIQKVWDIRDIKYELRDQLIEQRQKIIRLNEELPQSMHKLGPDIPVVDAAEFPEKKLQPEVILPEENFNLDIENVVEPIKVPDQDQEEHELLPERSDFPIVVNGVFKCDYSSDAITSVMESNFDLLMDGSEESDSPFESDIRTRRLTRKLFEQKRIISEMEMKIQDFNDILEDAKKNRLPIHVGGNFIDMYIHTLNQELNVLKEFEDGEDALSQRVNEDLECVHKLQDVIDVHKMSQEEYNMTIENMHEEEHKIQEKFKHASENSKFYEFLKKVFRKKYKPPKQVDADDSSSDSSSSSSEESEVEDTSSIDSRDFGIIKQDLNVCPKGCELAIYNLTVELRSKRHDIEQAVKEQTRSLEMTRKSIEVGNRKMITLQNQLRASQKELEDYQREKQRKLNQVRCVIVLRLDQLHDYNPQTNEITDYLIFSKTTLTDLYKRVGTLEHEDFEQKSKYLLYQKHLTRLKKDLRYMRDKVKSLKQHIIRIMHDKFGKVVDITEIEYAILKKAFHKSHVNELEEVVLKKLVYDLRMENTDVKKLFTLELNVWQEKISNAQAELTNTIKENTKRLELLQVMSKEKKELVKVISLQPKRKEQIEHILKVHLDYSKEIEKLERIIQDQCSQLHVMKSEMSMLKTKSQPPREKVKEDMSVVKKGGGVGDDWTAYDKYIKTEEAVAPPVVKEETTIQEFHSTEVEDILQSLLRDLDLKDSEPFDVESMVKNILSNILRCTSVQAIINEIIDNLPFEPGEKQLSIIDSTADKIHQLQEPDMSEEDIGKCIRSLLEDTIDEVLLTSGEVHEVISRLVEKLVESIPMDFLLQEESIESIVTKVSDAVGELELDRGNLLKSVDSIPSIYKREIFSILNIILERVYGSGIDYMYVVKYD